MKNKKKIFLFSAFIFLFKTSFTRKNNSKHQQYSENIRPRIDQSKKDEYTDTIVDSVFGFIEEGYELNNENHSEKQKSSFTKILDYIRKIFKILITTKNKRNKRGYYVIHEPSNYKAYITLI